MSLNYEKGYAALREALPPEQHPRWENLHREWQEQDRARRMFGDTEQLRHNRTKLYKQFLELAREIDFDLHHIVMGE